MSDEESYAYAWIEDITISREDHLKPIENYPYLNTFQTLDEQEAFTVIDENEDRSTWDFAYNSDDNWFARYTYNETFEADDWLISPELPGIAQEISFAIGALDVQYGPSSYEVLVSSTDSEIASFTKVAEGTLTSAGWNSVTAQLPEGTKYFAIRNNTSGDGAMCVMLGDIKFTANSSATVASFNIYYNNEKIATVDGDKTTYTVAADKVEVGTQTFGVSAVYANGAESRVTTATIEIVTGIEQIAADGKPVDVYSIDGKLIRNQAKSLDGLKGLYIVNGKKIMVK